MLASFREKLKNNTLDNLSKKENKNKTITSALKVKSCTRIPDSYDDSLGLPFDTHNSADQNTFFSQVQERICHLSFSGPDGMTAVRVLSGH